MNLEALASEAIEIAIETVRAEAARAGLAVDAVALVREAAESADTDAERRALAPPVVPLAPGVAILRPSRVGRA